MKDDLDRELRQLKQAMWTVAIMIIVLGVFVAILSFRVANR